MSLLSPDVNADSIVITTHPAALQDKSVLKKKRDALLLLVAELKRQQEAFAAHVDVKAWHAEFLESLASHPINYCGAAALERAHKEGVVIALLDFKRVLLKLPSSIVCDKETCFKLLWFSRCDVTTGTETTYGFEGVLRGFDELNELLKTKVSLIAFLKALEAINREVDVPVDAIFPVSRDSYNDRGAPELGILGAVQERAHFLKRLAQCVKPHGVIDLVGFIRELGLIRAKQTAVLDQVRAEHATCIQDALLTGRLRPGMQLTDLDIKTVQGIVGLPRNLLIPTDRLEDLLLAANFKSDSNLYTLVYSAVLLSLVLTKARYDLLDKADIKALFFQKADDVYAIDPYQLAQYCTAKKIKIDEALASDENRVVGFKSALQAELARKGPTLFAANDAERRTIIVGMLAAIEKKVGLPACDFTQCPEFTNLAQCYEKWRSSADPSAAASAVV